MTPVFLNRGIKFFCQSPFYSCLLRELPNRSSITIVTLVLTPLFTSVLTVLSCSHFGSYTVVIHSLWVLRRCHPVTLVLTLFINSFVRFLIPFVISVYGSSTAVTSFSSYTTITTLGVFTSHIYNLLTYSKHRIHSIYQNQNPVLIDDSKAHSAHYKGMSERRGNQNLNHGKPYSAPADKGKQRAADGKRPSRGGALTPLKCYRCGDLGHHVSKCESDVKKCYKCGKSGHLVVDCKKNVVTCYNCGEPGHISTHCPKPKQASTRVLALMGTQTFSGDRLIRGICYINNTPSIVIIDTGVTHSFIVVDHVKRIGLVVSSMNREMVIKTPTKGSVTTNSVCLNCPILIFDKDFGIDLICLPLENLDVISGMNWLEFNHVHINCYNKLVRFLTLDEEEKAGFWYGRELKELLEEEAQVFVLFAALSAKS
ncbi:uncharacterized protein LOC127122285 [Lathyrus oleraceus]|uniref:uncharacterized protein LOC127122285 n=1 Tax=Pisum sativum TaxID=3888 RepID=UPI0021D2A32E|nr:uncharacterized protein LOC127122285 [Pisum sativum]